MSIEDLERDVAQRLLGSTIPARLAFTRPDGHPDVLPIWFLWREGALVMCAQAGGFKVQAIRRQPTIAVSIDAETPPYESIRLRGRAQIEVVDGIPQDYVDCAHRYYGAEQGDAWIDFLRPLTRQMARITLTPDWAEVWDFRERFPDLFGA